ncbi:MAG: radical SAM family heme chaperone HemW, partial [Tepidisphaerales bacterium]
MQLSLAGQPDPDVADWQPRGLAAVEVPGLYLHVPFCFHKCHYCDFYSITRQSPQRMERFVDRILREARGWAAGGRGPTVKPATIFFGGGTPSLLPLQTMRRLLAGLCEVFDCSAVTEWTIECNPATVDDEYCRMLRESGVNRLSFGAQSFDDRELDLLERHHRPDDVPRSLDIARRAGFERLNLDLIYAIPGQTLASWEKSLAAGLSLGTEHLSCYGLTYEPNTPFTVRRRLGQFAATEESMELAMLHRTRQTLAAAGLPAYEISNYARPGAECRHN